jgi:hypothetical protein
MPAIYDRETLRRMRSDALPMFTRYAEARVLPRLGAHGAAKLTDPAEGRRSLIYFLEADGISRHLLRGDRDRRVMRARVVSHALLQRLGLRAPEIPFADLRLRTRLRWGLYFLVETFLEGESLATHEDPAASASAFGELLAKAHSHTGRPGHIGAFRSPWPGLPSKFRARAADWLKRYVRAGGPEADALRSFIERFLASIRHEARLIVGNITPTNVLIGPSGAGLIDVTGLMYGSARYELIRVREKSFPGRPELFDSFLESYLAASDPAWAERVQDTLSSFEVIHHMRQFSRAGDDAQRKARHRDVLARAWR